MTLERRLILAPPSRAEIHPLASLLDRRGAEALRLPVVEPCDPSSFEAADAAIAEIDRFETLVFTGDQSVERFFARRPGAEERVRGQLIALGARARKALRALGLEVAHTPRRHVPPDVADLLGEVEGQEILLVRREGVSRELPRLLRERGARVTEADGYGMTIHTDPADVTALTDRPIEAIAFTNPTSAGFLGEALGRWGLGAEVFDRAIVGAAGEFTARAARAIGLTGPLVVGDTLRQVGDRLDEALGDR